MVERLSEKLPGHETVPLVIRMIQSPHVGSSPSARLSMTSVQQKAGRPGLDPIFRQNGKRSYLFLRLVLAAFGTADDQFTTKEFLVVKLRNCALGLVDSLHLHESKSFGALIMTIAHNLGILHVPDSVEELKQITLARIERKISDVQSRRRHFD